MLDFWQQKILATSDAELLNRLKAYTKELKESVQAKDAHLKEVGYKKYMERRISNNYRLIINLYRLYIKGRRGYIRQYNSHYTHVAIRKMDYKKAGVDIEAGYKSVELMKEHVAKTMREEVLTNLGGFSGAFSMESSRAWKSRHLYQVLMV